MTMTAPDLEGLAEALDATITPAAREETRPRFNVAPSQPHPIALLEGARAVIVPAAWGFFTKQRPHQPNVRAETAASRFAGAFDGRRAVIPADGFYEWSGTGAARKPSWITRAGGGPLLFAGLWENDGAGGRRFAVITVAANGDVAPLHDRMPALLLRPEDARRWLRTPDAGLLVPAPEGTLVSRVVTTRVNKVDHDDAKCLDADDGRGQLRLL